MDLISLGVLLQCILLLQLLVYWGYSLSASQLAKATTKQPYMHAVRQLT